MLTTNHLGTFEFTLCKLNEPHELETEECFEEHKIQLADKSGTVYQVDISIPEGSLVCDRPLRPYLTIGAAGVLFTSLIHFFS